MNNENNPKEYEDIIYLPHHVSKKHPPMPSINRAAQFSPFAALTGYEDMIDETARFVSGKAEIEEDQKAVINRRLRFIEEHIKEEPAVTVTHFVSDRLKAGGKYETSFDSVIKVDAYEKLLVMKNGARILWDDIAAIELQ